jgi:hypothetical protein
MPCRSVKIASGKESSHEGNRGATPLLIQSSFQQLGILASDSRGCRPGTSTGEALLRAALPSKEISPGTLDHFSREHPGPLALGLPSPSE